MTTLASTSRFLGLLRDQYPNLFAGEPGQWKARVVAYHSKLRRWDDEILSKACQRATDKYPDRFPTAGQIGGLCQNVEVELREAWHLESARIGREREDADNAQRVADLREKVIPDSRADQERWCSTGKPFERLARYWECESKNNGWDPNRPAPRGVGGRRMKEFFDLMTTLDVAKKVDKTQAPRGGSVAQDNYPEPGSNG